MERGGGRGWLGGEDLSRHGEQPRADLELATFCRRQGHIETHLVLNGDEIDHASGRDRVFAFGDRENRVSPGCGEYLAKAAGLRPSDEQHMQPGEPFATAQAATRHGT